MPGELFDRAVAAIDAANAEDPVSIVVDGVARPKELVHGEMVARWVARLRPGAGEVELLAARAHHLRRWTRPRADYPEGRAGYLRWRRDAARRHAEEVHGLLVAVGCDAGTADRVAALVAKDRHADAGALQANEDARCLVFLQTQFGATIDQLGEDKVVEVVRKTVAKMSPAALALVGELDLDERERRVVAAATGSATTDRDHR
ncbi:MAG: DUF4202 domain-containing protein [Acidimicrobiia bacterium]